MNKTSSKKSPVTNHDLPIVEQFRKAWLKTNRIPTLIGFILGGFVPIAAAEISHFEVQVDRALWAVVVAALLFSAFTVFIWAEKAFKSPFKAAGFCVLLEGVLTFSHSTLLVFSALVLLIGINGIATGCILALDGKKVRK